MGFMNIGGQKIHTSVIVPQSGLTTSVASSGIISVGTGSNITTTITTGSPWTVYGSNTINYTIQKQTYHILGEDVEVDSGYVDITIAVMISTLNVLGKPFYDELKKNKVSFPKEIEDYLELKFKILERDRKINDVLK